MKIYYICDSIIPSRSANSIHVMKMCQAFARDGHEVTLLAPRLKCLEEPGIKDIFGYYRVEKCFQLFRMPILNVYGKPLIFGLFFVPFFLMKNRPQMVYGRSAFACFASAFLGIPTKFESHAPLCREFPLTRWFQKKMFRQKAFKGLVVISKALKKMYLEDFKTDNLKIAVAHDGADMVLAAPVQKWPGRSQTLQVGYVGHLYQGRGIEIIMALAQKNPDLDFHLIGGTDCDINFWKNQNQMSNLYIHGFVPPGMVPSYREKCDILLAPYQEKCSISGGSGNTSAYMSPLKVFEYMSSGRAIVASDFPVLREVLNETNAVLVPPEDIDAWFGAIERLKNEKIRKQFSDKALHDFLNDHTWEKRAQRVLG